MRNQIMIRGLLGLDEEESVTAFDCHLDRTELLLEELTGALHHASGGLGDELVFGRRGEGEARSDCSTNTRTHFFEGRYLL